MNNTGRLSMRRCGRRGRNGADSPRNSVNSHRLAAPGRQNADPCIALQPVVNLEHGIEPAETDDAIGKEGFLAFIRN